MHLVKEEMGTTMGIMVLSQVNQAILIKPQFIE